MKALKEYIVEAKSDIDFDEFIDDAKKLLKKYSKL